MEQFNKDINQQGYSVTENQTDDLNKVGIESTIAVVDSTVQANMDHNLPPVDSQKVGETAETAREAINKLIEANQVIFDEKAAKNDILSVQNADKGVVSVSLRIIDGLSSHLKSRADKLAAKAAKRAAEVNAREAVALQDQFAVLYGQKVANVEQKATNVMLTEVSGKKDAAKRGLEGRNIFSRIFLGTKERISQKVSEYRYSKSRSEMQKLTARSQFCRLLSDGLGSLSRLVTGTIQRTNEQTQNTYNETAAQNVGVVQQADQEYNKFVS